MVINDADLTEDEDIGEMQSKTTTNQDQTAICRLGKRNISMSNLFEENGAIMSSSKRRRTSSMC
jgi:hypothetical protein